MRLNFVRSALAASAFFLAAAGAAHAENRGGRDPGAACRNPGGGEAAAGQEGVELDIKVFSDYVQPTCN